MPGCSLEREVIGSTVLYRISGKFDGACAWELASRLDQEPLCDVVVDFGRVNEFADYGISVLASSLVPAPRSIQLRGLRQHQDRLFRYFGVDPDGAPRTRAASPLIPAGAGATKEVA